MNWTNVLIAFDGSESAERAVDWAARMFARVEGVKLTLFAVMDKLPSYDMEETVFTEQVKTRIAGLEMNQVKLRDQLAEAQARLLQKGFGDQQVAVETAEVERNVAATILAQAKGGNFGTIVLGRQGHSRIEEFLLGSTSHSVVGHLKEATVCVVE